jgi:hypothetical protein
MIVLIAGLLAIGIALPHGLRLERCPPATAAALWTASLALRALTTIFAVLYLAFFLPSTTLFADLTHWCWHTVLPLLTTQLGLEGHNVGDAATILPGLLVMVSLLSVAFGVFRAARAVKRLLARDSLGPGPSESVIVAGSQVILAAAGLTRPKVLVSAGALVELEDDELAAGLDHEHGHIARRHRFLLVFAEMCRGIGRFTPGCRRAMRELAFHLERDADQWALRRSHDRLALASAICKAAAPQLTDRPAVTPLGGGGAGERLGQLIDDRPVPRPRASAAALNALAVGMVCLTILIAALVPSTALAGAQDLGGGHQIHQHCDH